MKKFLAGLVLSAAMVTGAATIATAPANAAGIYVNVGGHDHHHWRNHHRGYYHHNRYWHNRYRCHRHGWCYR
jgi:Spy/CpxP family protein refolding chaperone